MIKHPLALEKSIVTNRDSQALSPTLTSWVIDHLTPVILLFSHEMFTSRAQNLPKPTWDCKHLPPKTFHSGLLDAVYIISSLSSILHPPQLLTQSTEHSRTHNMNLTIVSRLSSPWFPWVPGHLFLSVASSVCSNTHFFPFPFLARSHLRLSCPRKRPGFGARIYYRNSFRRKRGSEGTCESEV